MPSDRWHRPAAVLPLVVLALVAGCGGGPSGAAPTAGTRGTGPTRVTAADRAGLLALLAARDDALARGAAPAGDPFLARVAQVPFTAWRSRLVSLAPAAGGRLDVRVRVSYRLPGDTRDVLRDRALIVDRAGDRPRVVSDVPDGAPRDPWDLGPVRVLRTGRVLLLAADTGAGSAARAAADAAAATAAADRVDAVWGRGWRRTVVVLAPAADGDAAALAGRPVAALSGSAAWTTGSVDPGPGGRRDGDERVVLVPSGWSALTDAGRGVVLAHEASHVAARAGARFAVPLWFEEGLADVVAYSGTGLPERDVLGDALDGVRSAGIPDALPSQADFDPATGDPDAAYALSWLACRALAAGGGPGRLVEVYRVASGREPPEPGGPAAADPAAAWAAALALAGTDEAGLVTRWRAEVTRAARIAG